MSEHKADAVDWQVIRNMAAQSDSPEMFGVALLYAGVSGAIHDPMIRGALESNFPIRKATVGLIATLNGVTGAPAKKRILVGTEYTPKRGKIHEAANEYPELFNFVHIGRTSMNQNFVDDDRPDCDVFRDEYFSRKEDWTRTLFVLNECTEKNLYIDFPVGTIILINQSFGPNSALLNPIHHRLSHPKRFKEGQRWIHCAVESTSPVKLGFSAQNLVDLLPKLPENLKPFHWLFMDSIGEHLDARMIPETFHRLRKSGVKMIASEEYKEKWFSEIREVQTFVGDIEDWIFATNLKGEPL